MTRPPPYDGRIAELFAAAAASRADDMRELLAAGVDPVQVNEDGMTPLALTVSRRSGRAFDAAMADPRTAASVNMKLENWHNGGVLALAVRANCQDMVERLLAAGALVNFQDDMGRTALNAAISNGNEQMVSVLLEAGADVVGIADQSGVTPLAQAAQMGFSQLMPQLLDAGADINAVDKDGLTIAHLAVMCNSNPLGVLEVYQAAGGDLNRRDREGQTPYDLAEWTKNEKAMGQIRDLLACEGREPAIAPKPLRDFGWGGFA